jgi:hypothetical protein
MVMIETTENTEGADKKQYNAELSVPELQLRQRRLSSADFSARFVLRVFRSRVGV